MKTVAQSNRDLIFVTAERLFAERGIDNTSVRQINQAAGQRNSSATQYHFGSKTKLVEAIFAQRTGTVDNRCASILNTLEATDDFRNLVMALVIPFAEHITRDSRCYYYIQLAFQSCANPIYYQIFEDHTLSGKGIAQLSERVMAQLRHLPKSVALRRFEIALRQVIGEIANLQRLTAASPAGIKPDTAFIVSDLIDSINAGLQAPWSNESTNEHERLTRRSA